MQLIFSRSEATLKERLSVCSSVRPSVRSSGGRLNGSESLPDGSEGQLKGSEGRLEGSEGQPEEPDSQPEGSGGPARRV